MQLEFVFTRAFERTINGKLSDEEIRQVQVALLRNPDAGDPVSGASGLRKIRVAMQGRGKRAGGR
jgi:hypothetical protein